MKQGRPASVILAWVWAALVAFAIPIVIVSIVRAGQMSGDGVFFMILIPIYAGLGLVIAIREPGNRVAWLLFTVATYGVLQGAAIARIGDPSTPPSPVTAWDIAALVFTNTGYFILLIIPLLLLMFTFPTGRFLTRRWSWAGWLGLVSGITMLLSFTFAESLGVDGQEWLIVNPIGFLDSSNSFANGLLGWIFGVGLIAIALGAIPAAVVRYRRAGTDVRTQIKWVVFGSLVGITLFLFSIVFNASLPAWVSDALFGVLISVFPLSITIAITRYRLYEIDVVISRTVVLAVVAAFITATYALVVVVVGQLIGGDSDSLLLPIGATAVVAVAFEPVRHRAQRWANRLVFGNRATPYEVLSDLTERLSGAEASEGILNRMAQLLREGTGAERASIWLGDRNSMVNAATAPPEARPSATIDLEEEASFAVIHDGEVVGALEVVKPKGTALSSAERALIADLGGSAGAVLGYQRLNDSLSRRAAELEESRTRLLGVQDGERRRLEQDLHEGAEQFIVALKVKLGVASQLAARAGNEKLESLLADLTAEAQAALDDVQSLAKGIYPPVLEADGLGAAVSALANSSPVEVHVEGEGVGRHPAEVEAAVYFGVAEAVTNAVKHAQPPIRVALAEANGTLEFSVTDDGPGFDIDRSDMGSGLENMADRLQSVGGSLRVTSAQGSRTEVSGTIPV